MHSTGSFSSIDDALAVAEADVASPVPLSCCVFDDCKGAAAARRAATSATHATQPTDRLSFVRSVGPYHDV